MFYFFQSRLSPSLWIHHSTWRWRKRRSRPVVQISVIIVRSSRFTPNLRLGFYLLLFDFFISLINSRDMSLPDSLPSSSSSPPVTREETGYQRFEHGHDNGFDHRDRQPWNRSEYDYRHGSIVASENVRNSSTSEDPWSCVVVVATFCIFGEIKILNCCCVSFVRMFLFIIVLSLNLNSVSMTLILGLYGTTNVWLGPNSSFLIKPTSVFVQNVIVCSLLSCIRIHHCPTFWYQASIFLDFLKVEELGNKGSGLMLYGLNQAPQLDVLAKWSEVHYLAVPNDSYKVTSLGALYLFYLEMAMKRVLIPFGFAIFFSSIGYSIWTRGHA